MDLWIPFVVGAITAAGTFLIRARGRKPFVQNRDSAAAEVEAAERGIKDAHSVGLKGPNAHDRQQYRADSRLKTAIWLNKEAEDSLERRDNGTVMAVVLAFVTPAILNLALEFMLFTSRS